MRTQTLVARAPLAAAVLLLAACSDSPAPLAPDVAAPALAKNAGSTTGGKGRIFVVASYDEPANSDIYVMNGDGTGARRITTAPQQDKMPSATPDGRLVAFVRVLDSSTGHGDIFVGAADGSWEQQLTNTPDVDETDPAISPDGTRIVFTHQPMTGSSIPVPSEDAEIAVINVDGSGFALVTDNDAGDREASWSRKGDRIVFVSDRDNMPPEVYTMAPDGSAVTRVTVNAALWEARPAFSPDDRRILFTTNSPSELALYVMNADGSQLSRLTTGAVQPYSASWAPSGKEIVFESLALSDIVLFVAKPGALGETQLTTGGFTLMPFWTK